MRIALLTNIQGNAIALDAVLADVAALGAWMNIGSGPGIRPDYAETELVARIAGCGADLLCVGHIHWPMDLRLGDIHVVNWTASAIHRRLTFAPGMLFWKWDRPAIGSTSARWLMIGPRASSFAGCNTILSKQD